MTSPWPAVQVRSDPRHPRAAPAFRCSQCRRWIGKRRPVAVIIGENVTPVIVCVRCADADPGVRLRFGTRAGTARRLGIWPGPALRRTA